MSAMRPSTNSTNSVYETLPLPSLSKRRTNATLSPSVRSKSSSRSAVANSAWSTFPSPSLSKCSKASLMLTPAASTSTKKFESFVSTTSMSTATSASSFRRAIRRRIRSRAREVTVGAFRRSSGFPKRSVAARRACCAALCASHTSTSTPSALFTLRARPPLSPLAPPSVAPADPEAPRPKMTSQ